MSRCCSEYNCRRKMPILVRRAAFSGRWTVITKYTRTGSLIKAVEKHDLDGATQAEIELCGSVLQDLFAHVEAQYKLSAPHSDAEAAYRDVLDKLQELAEAKETALVGPPPATTEPEEGTS